MTSPLVDDCINAHTPKAPRTAYGSGLPRSMRSNLRRNWSPVPPAQVGRRARRLEVGHPFAGLVIAATLHLDLGCGVGDLGEFVG